MSVCFIYEYFVGYDRQIIILYIAYSVFLSPYDFFLRIKCVEKLFILDMFENLTKTSFSQFL